MPRMTLTAKEARQYVHEDTSRTREAFAGYQDVDGQRVPTYGSVCRTVCGHWLPMWDENRRFWRGNDEKKPIDCPACLYEMAKDADLTDAATGGILWVMAGRPDVEWSPAAGIVRILPRHGTAAGKGSVEGPTLGEACAALMVARGRCG